MSILFPSKEVKRIETRVPNFNREDFPAITAVIIDRLGSALLENDEVDLMKYLSPDLYRDLLENIKKGKRKVVYKSKSDIGKENHQEKIEMDERLEELIDIVKGTVIDSRVIEGRQVTMRDIEFTQIVARIEVETQTGDKIKRDMLFENCGLQKKDYDWRLCYIEGITELQNGESHE